MLSRQDDSSSHETVTTWLTHDVTPDPPPIIYPTKQVAGLSTPPPSQPRRSTPTAPCCEQHPARNWAAPASGRSPHQRLTHDQPTQWPMMWPVAPPSWPSRQRLAVRVLRGGEPSSLEGEGAFVQGDDACALLRGFQHLGRRLVRSKTAPEQATAVHHVQGERKEHQPCRPRRGEDPIRGGRCTSSVQLFTPLPGSLSEVDIGKGSGGWCLELVQV